jgi:hypothetical protein
MKTVMLRLGLSLVIPFTAALTAACSPDAPLAPSRLPTTPRLSKVSGPETAELVATVQRATARYHNFDAAVADGFVFLHGCETRPDEGPVGTVYVNFDRLLDGVGNPALPDALIYEPRRDGRLGLVGVELAIPYALWPQQDAPALLGTTFQREDEFGVFGLHVWVWRDNPEGLFAESNPRVTCDE